VTVVLRALALPALLLAIMIGAARIAPPAMPVRHSSGIVLLPPLDIGPFVRARERMGEAAFEPLAKTYSDARQIAMTQRDSFGIPWIDIAHGEVVIRVARPGAERSLPLWSARVRIEATDRTYGQLEKIQHDAIGRGAAGYAGENRVWTSSIDDESQRVVLETDRVIDGFLIALARRYGTEIIAVRVDPRSGPFRSI
jgi:hypothetical protein